MRLKAQGIWAARDRRRLQLHMGHCGWWMPSAGFSDRHRDSCVFGDELSRKGSERTQVGPEPIIKVTQQHVKARINFAKEANLCEVLLVNRAQKASSAVVAGLATRSGYK